MQRRRVFLETKPADCEAKKGWWTLGGVINPLCSLINGIIFITHVGRFSLYEWR